MKLLNCICKQKKFVLSDWLLKFSKKLLGGHTKMHCTVKAIKMARRKIQWNPDFKYSGIPNLQGKQKLVREIGKVKKEGKDMVFD